MARANPEVVVQILKDTIVPGKETSWADISAAVKEKLTIKNWLTEVRGPLQYLLDTGVIERRGIGFEHYIRLKD
jgi:hypothetical protein